VSDPANLALRIDPERSPLCSRAETLSRHSSREPEEVYMTYSVVHVAAPVQPAYVALPQGRVVVVRPAEPADSAAVAVLHSRCGPRTLHDRYLGPPPRLTSGILRDLVAPAGGCALAAVTRSGDVVGLLQLCGDGSTADLAVVVRDDYQHVGLGSLLARHAVRTAASLGFTELTARGLATNDRLVRMLGRLGLARHIRREDGFVHLRAPLVDVAPSIDLTAPRRTAGVEPAA
jgi:GNAT superfamily N-acetyltransferase